MCVALANVEEDRGIVIKTFGSAVTRLADHLLIRRD